MEATAPLIVLVDSRLEPAARCAVCGDHVAAGAGLTARYGGRTLRFKCPGCLERFRADPGRFLEGHARGCCQGAGHGASPASEWRCD